MPGSAGCPVRSISGARPRDTLRHSPDPHLVPDELEAPFGAVGGERHGGAFRPGERLHLLVVGAVRAHHHGPGGLRVRERGHRRRGRDRRNRRGRTNRRSRKRCFGRKACSGPRGLRRSGRDCGGGEKEGLLSRDRTGQARAEAPVDQNGGYYVADAEELASSGGIRLLRHEWARRWLMRQNFAIDAAYRGGGSRAWHLCICAFYGGRRCQDAAFCVFGDDVISGLKWIERVLAPTLKAAVIAMHGGLPLKPIMAQVLHMSDDVHNRNTAATLMLLRSVAEFLLQPGMQNGAVVETSQGAVLRRYVFFRFSMAVCKVTMECGAWRAIQQYGHRNGSERRAVRN